MWNTNMFFGESFGTGEKNTQICTLKWHIKSFGKAQSENKISNSQL